MSSHQQIPGRNKLWLTFELKDRGLTELRIREMVSSSQLIRVRRGCYADGPWWRGLVDDDARAVQILHAHLRAMETVGVLDGAYSHTSAARVHGVYLWRPDPLIHISRPSSGSPTSHAADVRSYKAMVPPSEVTWNSGLPVTSLERTVVDCSRIFAYQSALIAAESSFWMGADRELVDSVLSRMRGFKGIARARQVMANASSLSESPGETLALDSIRAMRIPVPEQQLRVETRNGPHRLDFAWREHKVALEFDGRSKYFDYAPTNEVLFQERRREKALIEEGWTIIRIEWADLFREVELRERIMRALLKNRMGMSA
ncbi:hypothetical protein [Arthrobacter castelli]|uniref:hypothetical protein n=1 Tax=Arthrobacter castelli TaxID=271431 RepID=UPI00040C4475|nr:hypothetical protein [Arthrobacter castelli]